MLPFIAKKTSSITTNCNYTENPGDVVGWDPMGYVPFDGLAYISWTLAPFGMIPIGPGSSSSKDRPTVIKITSLTHPLACLSLMTPPPHRSFVSNIKTCDSLSD